MSLYFLVFLMVVSALAGMCVVVLLVRHIDIRQRIIRLSKWELISLLGLIAPVVAVGVRVVVSEFLLSEKMASLFSLCLLMLIHLSLFAMMTNRPEQSLVMKVAFAFISAMIYPAGVIIWIIVLNCMVQKI